MRTRYVDVSLHTYAGNRNVFLPYRALLPSDSCTVVGRAAFLFRHILLSRDALAPAFTSANTFAALTPRREKSHHADSQGHTPHSDEKSTGVEVTKERRLVDFST